MELSLRHMKERTAARQEPDPDVDGLAGCPTAGFKESNPAAEPLARELALATWMRAAKGELTSE